MIRALDQKSETISLNEVPMSLKLAWPLLRQVDELDDIRQVPWSMLQLTLMNRAILYNLALENR